MKMRIFGRRPRPSTMEQLRNTGSRPNVIQIVPPRHCYQLTALTADRDVDVELATGPLRSPTGPNGAEGFRNKAGSQIAVPHVTNIYMGAFWGDRTHLEGFTKAVLENGYLDPLKRLGYGTGSGRYLGPLDATPIGQRTIHDREIQNILAKMLDGGALQADASTLFMLLLPKGVIVQLDSDNKKSCASFCGYHESFVYKGLDVPYGVMPSSVGCNSCADGDMGYFTAAYVHELVEACTDKIPGDGWVSATGQESADLEAWQHFGWGPPDDPKRYVVQGYYTNEEGNTIGTWRDSAPAEGVAVA